MQTDKSVQTLYGMLNLLPKDRVQAFLQVLPQNISLGFQTAPKPSYEKEHISLKELFGKIHESWFEHILKARTPHDRRFLLSLFPKERGEVLATSFGIDSPLYALEEDLENTFLHKLFADIFPHEKLPLPLYLLPTDILTPLALLSYETLQKICRFLGLYDLAPEIKTIIVAPLLQKLDMAFDEEEAKFIRELVQTKNRAIFEPIGINRWNGDISMLRQIIYERGLCRLYFALRLSPSDLEWILLHIFSKEEFNFCKHLALHDRPGVIDMLRDQVITTWKKVCNSSP